MAAGDAVVGADRMLDLAVRRELLLEEADRLAEDEVRPAKRAADRLVELVGDRRMLRREVDEGNCRRCVHRLEKRAGAAQA